MIQPVGNPAHSRLWAWPAKLCLLSSLLALSACSNLGGVPGSDNVLDTTHTRSNFNKMVAPVDQTILNDLSAVVVQIYDPIDTTLQINSEDKDATLQYFISKLVEQGFGIQRVSADQGANFVSYTRVDSTRNNKPHIRFSMNIGAVSISRDYAVARKHKVVPASMVRLSGTRVAVTVDEQAFSPQVTTNRSFAQAQHVASLNLNEQSPVISLITPELVEKVSANSSEGPSLQALNSSKIEINNLFYGDVSTFSSILDNFVKVDRQVIVFGNDSMILGDTNKSLIDQFVENKLRSNDVVSLVGCSNGPTALEIGNEGLALGRAKRVTEALLTRGVSRDRVLDEGCWAPVKANDRFPSRGVVMELWRRNA